MSEAIALVGEALAQRLRELDRGVRVEQAPPTRTSGRGPAIALWPVDVRPDVNARNRPPAMPEAPVAELLYLLVVSGDDAAAVGRLLGRAWIAMHDRPLIAAEELADAASRLGLEPAKEQEEPVEVPRAVIEPLDLAQKASVWHTLDGVPLQPSLAIRIGGLRLV